MEIERIIDIVKEVYINVYGLKKMERFKRHRKTRCYYDYGKRHANHDR